MPRNSPEEEIASTRKIKKGDRQALNKLVRSSLKFVFMLPGSMRDEDCRLMNWSTREI